MMVTTVKELEEIYGKARTASIDKEIDYLNAYYRALVEASPFMALASNKQPAKENDDCQQSNGL